MPLAQPLRLAVSGYPQHLLAYKRHQRALWRINAAVFRLGVLLLPLQLKSRLPRRFAFVEIRPLHLQLTPNRNSLVAAVNRCKTPNLATETH